MAEGRETAPEKPGAEESSWLEKYYTNSKTGEDLDSVLPETGPKPAELLSANSGEKYDLTGQVGAGGMKNVLRAHDRNADRDVALATLRKAAPHSSQERRFLREARITAALEHPNIVPVHEIGLDSGNHPYFTMKLLGGENLHDILNHVDAEDVAYLKRFQLARLLEIFQNVCHAIAFAHSRGVVHLDLKPANIQVGSFGEVLVLDWGLAKILEHPKFALAEALVKLPEALREVPVDGAVRGTPGYMAPEQQQGDFKALDERTDIYALGAVLRAMVHGKRPRENRPPRKVQPALDAVVAKAMAPDPADRYPSVSELARDVRNFVGGFAVSAQTVGVGTLFWLLLKRHKAVSAVVAVSLVTITVLLTVFFVKITYSERRAVLTAKRLKAEQEEKVRLGRIAIPQLINDANALLRNNEDVKAMDELNLVVALDASKADAWVLKGLLHLGLQEFEDALKSFDRAPLYARRAKPDKILHAGEIAEKYLAYDRPNGLSYAQLTQLVEDVTRPGNGLTPAFQEIVLRRIFDRANQKGLAGPAHMEFVGNSLCLMNPASTNIVYQYQMLANGLGLELHGDRVTQLMPLTGLRFYALDISRTAVVDLNYLRNSGLQVLDLSGTPVKELSPIFDLPITNLRLVNCPNIRVDQLRNFTRLEQITLSERLAAALEKVVFQTPDAPVVTWE